MRSEFHKIVVVILYEIERSTGSSELLISYKQFLLTFQLHDYDLLGLTCEFRVSLKFHMTVLVLLHKIE